MPELPEVTTTVRGLQKVLPGLVITHVWTDLAKKNPIAQFAETLKSESFYKKFKSEVEGVPIKKVERRAKNILISLSNKKTIVIHLKMTGHIIYGQYVYTKNKNEWKPDPSERVALHDPYNRFVHVVFSLSNGTHFILSDSRKFATVTLKDTDSLADTQFKHIGPEPLDKDFTFEKFRDLILKKPKRAIKTILTDQSIVAGIGNIYSDEMLWLAGVHPESTPYAVPTSLFKKLFQSMQDVLIKGIDFGGDSMSDYRDTAGERGSFQHHHNVYRLTKTACRKRGCRGVILRKVINGRSAHFCSLHQKIFN